MKYPKIPREFVAIFKELFVALPVIGLSAAERAAVDGLILESYFVRQEEAETSYTRLAELTRCSKRTIRNGLNGLEEKGLIRVVEIGKGRSLSRYKFVWKNFRDQYLEVVGEENVHPEILAIWERDDSKFRVRYTRTLNEDEESRRVRYTRTLEKNECALYPHSTDFRVRAGTTLNDKEIMIDARDHEIYESTPISPSVDSGPKPQPGNQRSNEEKKSESLEQKFEKLLVSKLSPGGLKTRDRIQLKNLAQVEGLTEAQMIDALTRACDRTLAERKNEPGKIWSLVGVALHKCNENFAELLNHQAEPQPPPGYVNSIYRSAESVYLEKLGHIPEWATQRPEEYL